MIAALILAAGQSKRMGQPKLLLPWGETTVLGQVIETLQQAGVEQFLAITGGARPQVGEILAGHAIPSVNNPAYASGEMLSSIQCGLQALTAETEAALITLGDQPQIEVETVRAVRQRFAGTKAGILVPSYHMRRGHPWLVARPFWDEILQMKSGLSPRDFLNMHAREIEYVNVETPSILADLDTPQDYLKSRP